MFSFIYFIWAFHLRNEFLHDPHPPSFCIIAPTLSTGCVRAGLVSHRGTLWAGLLPPQEWQYSGIISVNKGNSGRPWKNFHLGVSQPWPCTDSIPHLKSSRQLHPSTHSWVLSSCQITYWVTCVPAAVQVAGSTDKVLACTESPRQRDRQVVATITGVARRTFFK